MTESHRLMGGQRVASPSLARSDRKVRAPSRRMEHLWFVLYSLDTSMIFSSEYVGYLAKQTVRQLLEAKVIRTDKPLKLNERVTAGLIDELKLEDRINEEVRMILDAYQDEMHRTGAQYADMFKKVKNELAKKYKAVL